MAEQIYRDLTPGLCDVPDATWDVDPELYLDRLISSIPPDELATLGSDPGLLTLIKHARTPEPSDATKELLLRHGSHNLLIALNELYIEQLWTDNDLGRISDVERRKKVAEILAENETLRETYAAPPKPRFLRRVLSILH